MATRRCCGDPIDRLCRIFLERRSVFSGALDRSVAVDVEETDDEIVVTASLSGASLEDINVTIEDRVLSINTEPAT